MLVLRVIHMIVYKRAACGHSYSVATEHPLATYYAFKVLEEGGNAFDAALVASSVLCVVLPHLSGVGGDLLALTYSSESERVEFINGSGWAPRQLTVDRLRDEGLDGVPLYGPLSPVVPGYFEGFRLIHEKYSSLDLREILAPAIQIARTGHLASESLWDTITRYVEELRRDPGFRRVLSGSRKIVLTGLAEVLDEVARSGPRAFYEGWIAEELSKYLRGLGGVMEEEDLSHYRGEVREPIQAEYMGWRIIECPPNSQGATTLLLLNLLEEVTSEASEADCIERITNFVKAARIAYHVRNENLGDPRFVDVDLDMFTSKEKAKKLLEECRPGPVTVRPYDTTYFAVVDGDGNAVSLVQSLFHPFGSRVLVPRLGVILNNRASYFKMEGPDKLEPWKRPLHTLSSIIGFSENGEVLVLGTSGGDYRPQIHAYILQNLIQYKMSLQEAIGYPRLLLSNKEVIVEDALKTPDLIDDMPAVRRPYPSRTGVAQGIMVGNGKVFGVADIRGDGISIAL